MQLMQTRARRILLGFAAIFAVGALAIFLGLFEHSVVSPATDQPMTSAEMAALVSRGRYLTAAADCAACHNASGGAPWAGGQAFALPFGILYSTNISPDPETGIGGWSRADFQHAMRDGIGKSGRHLFPAMPYVSYRQMSEGDVDAIYAFLMTRQPIHTATPADSFPLPYIRQTMTFWNLVNLPDRGFIADASKSPEWNHGRYLVDALGHCGECHTPRDITMGMIASRYLRGAVIEDVDAPDITLAGLARLGFDRDSLVQFMRAGLGPQGVMTFSMHDVVQHSTRYLTQADAEAMAAYLIGNPPAQTVQPAALTSQADGDMTAGRTTYVAVCAGCHGVDGEGIPHMAPAMRTNATLRLPTAHNLLLVLTQGLPEHAFPDGEHFQAMPGFSNLLSAQQIADLVTYLRKSWGGQPRL
jgi:mono/diheme cytochrome c family protein